MIPASNLVSGFLTFFQIQKIKNADSNTTQVYKPIGNNARSEFLLNRVKNLGANEIIQLPVRSIDCLKLQCVYNFNMKRPNAVYACDHLNREVDIKSIYPDFRLANLIARIKKKRPEESKDPNFFKQIAVIIDDQNCLYARLPDNSEVAQYDFKTNQPISVKEDLDESKRELAATVNRVATGYVECLDIMGKVTQNLEGLVENTLKSIDLKKMASNVAEKAKSRRQCGKQAGLFAISYGSLITNINSTNRKFRSIELTSAGKFRFDDLIGAGWFYHFEPQQVDPIKRHIIFAVAGGYRLEGGGNTPSLHLKGDVLALGILPESQRNVARCIEYLSNRAELKVVYPAITYCRPIADQKYPYDGKAYIIGGIDKDNKPTDNILQYDPRTNELRVVGNLLKKRFNHTCTHYKGKIYVVGGVNFVNYITSQGGNTIKPYERISDLAFIPNIAETDIEIFQPGKKVQKKEPPYDHPKARQILIRQIAMVVPVVTKAGVKDFLAIFGGNCGVQLQSRQSVAYDIHKNQWVDFGQNSLNLAYCIGQDQPISLHNNIIDFEGEQYENSTIFLFKSTSLSKEPVCLIYTSKGSESSYKWIV